MKLRLERRYLGKEYTIGKLFIDGKYFCDTLEDTVKDLDRDGYLNGKDEVKVYGKTAIPFGTYRVILKKSPHFKRVLPRLLNVHHFEGILIHRGNTHKDTSGCILLGENKRKGMVLNSGKYEVKLVKLMQTAIGNAEKVFIEIV